MEQEKSSAPLGISPANTTILASEPVWVICPTCQQEVSYLGESGRCYECSEAENLKRRVAINLKEKEEKLFDGVEKALREFSFEKFNVTDGTKEAFESAKVFNLQKDNLFLWGSAGVGKTHLAYSIARAQIKSGGTSAKIIRTTELLRGLRGTTGTEEDTAIKKYSTIDCLVIDDLGVGRATEYAITILYEIIDKRYMSYKNGLIITSNLSLGDMSKKIEDDRLLSRLAAMCKVVRLTGDDRRL